MTDDRWCNSSKIVYIKSIKISTIINPVYFNNLLFWNA